MKVRSFIAIDPSPEVKVRIIEVIDRLRQGSGGIRWMTEDQLHLTLRFLGSVDEEILEQEIAPRLERLASQSPPISLTVRGIGFLPSPDRPRIVWVGVAGDVPSLQKFQQGVELAVQGLTPVSREDRHFRPHITIGRVHEPHKRYGMERILSIGEVADLGEFTADHLYLYKSDLTPRGARYTELGVFKLGG